MKLINKISSLLLVFLILVGITGFKVEKFYCGTYLKSTHVFTSPTPCCSETNTAQGKCRTEKEFFKVTIDSDLPVLSQKIEKVITSIIFSGVFTQFLFSKVQLSPTKYLNYKPPLLLKDVPIIIQSFLI